MIAECQVDPSESSWTDRWTQRQKGPRSILAGTGATSVIFTFFALLELDGPASDIFTPDFDPQFVLNFFTPPPPNLTLKFDPPPRNGANLTPPPNFGGKKNVYIEGVSQSHLYTIW